MKKAILILCCVLMFSACEDKQKKDAATQNMNADKEVVKIGSVLPLTGGGAALGASLKAGVLAAIEDKSKEKLKYKYEAVFEDSRMLPAQSATAAAKLINDDGADMILTYAAGSGRMVAPIADEAKILHMCATSEDENAQPMGKTSFFQGSTVQSYQNMLIKALKKQGVKKLALWGSRSNGCRDTERLAKILQNNGMDVKAECFNLTDDNFYFVVRNYIADGFEYFYLEFFPPQTDIIVKQLEENDIAPNHIFGSNIDTGEDILLFDGINHIGACSGNGKFINRMINEYKIENVHMAAVAYDLVGLAIDAFENAQDKKNIYELIGYIKVRATRKCMSGDCKLLDNGFIINEAEWRTYKNGKPVILEK
ncbi:MAG: ABC transporter substrate-binding protein [Alphaproteobacteria bacterium]|nr:ABC transporter substrate-binding protein [Alphaproteobacteria bacterium]